MTNTKLRCICCLLAVSYALSDRFVGGRKESSVKRKGTIKTIEGMDGDVTDCVNIYQQPAFDHPLLKNHIIQMKPSSIPNITNGEFNDAEMLQGLLDIGECPEGTIPVRHAREDEYYEHRALPSVPRRIDLNLQDEDNELSGTRYARVGLSGGSYQGAHALINVWNPVTKPGEVSIAQIWLRSGPSDAVNTIEAGWIVNLKDVNKAKMYVHWTRDGGQTTGCYNLDCPGFVQVNHKVALGSFIKPVSTYGAKQYEMRFQIYKSSDGHWWVKVQDQVLGYWPSSIVPNLQNGATEVSWGGQIYDKWQDDRHTTTQTGSGHFPSEGYGKASYFRNIQYMDSVKGNFIDVDSKALVPYVTEHLCYDVKVANDNNAGYRTHFYYGGPGLSVNCY